MRATCRALAQIAATVRTFCAGQISRSIRRSWTSGQAKTRYIQELCFCADHRTRTFVLFTRVVRKGSGSCALELQTTELRAS
ncbi:hypothetical protein NDU88_004630 [Pleurodeles waltl]|uniref:Secreted protein n=1 Tax=Pleurodeles waltl TaxID=8319 RepID=A0AAV7TT46_PLEWA|nr:hypothetical protein NDU88_004630 [Pleurodeles waltl]